MCEYQSEIYNKVTEVLLRVAQYDANVLLMGESGTGKSFLARKIHENSLRKKGPFVPIDLCSIPKELLESELFGYEKGSFTGSSTTGKPGLVEEAHNGTLFLDEIGDLPLSMQNKILKLLQDRQIRRVGGLREREIDFRLILATNCDLNTMLKTGSFRKDLYYRISGISITVPSLRERKEDIPILANQFLDEFAKKYDKRLEFSDELVEKMMDYDWPGNVRELENFVEASVVGTSKDQQIIAEITELGGNSLQTKHFMYQGRTLKEIMEELEKQVIVETYLRCGSTVQVAKELGISQASASIKIRKYVYET